jgi:hypothetical protein
MMDNVHPKITFRITGYRSICYPERRSDGRYGRHEANHHIFPEGAFEDVKRAFPIIQPVRLQLSRRKGFNLQTLSRATNGLAAVSVARPGPYGNWWSVGLRPCGCRSAGECTHNTLRTATAEEAVAAFRQELEIRIIALPEKYQPKLAALRGRNLACWCGQWCLPPAGANRIPGLMPQTDGAPCHRRRSGSISPLVSPTALLRQRAVLKLERRSGEVPHQMTRRPTIRTRRLAAHPGQLAGKLQVADRTLRDWLRQLRILFPDQVFYSGTERHKLFEEFHYQRIIQSLPCLSQPRSPRVANTSISAARSAPGRSHDPFTRVLALAQGLPGAAAKAEEIRLRREGEIYHELLYGPKTVVTFTQAAAAYCEDRNRQRLIANPALAGRPDPEALYVAKWIKFLRGRGVADIPLEDFITDERQRRKAAKDGRNTSHLKAYFDELHVAKGNKLSTMSRERDTYCTIMNFAADPERAWAPADYPAPELPDYDSFAVPVNKWLYDEEVRLFIKLAPKHLKIMVAGVFATGIRGGEFLFISRRAPNYADRNATGLNLDPGTEHFYLGWSKSKKPIFRTIPDWYVEMLHPTSPPPRSPRRPGAERRGQALQAPEPPERLPGAHGLEEHAGAGGGRHRAPGAPQSAARRPV